MAELCVTSKLTQLSRAWSVFSRGSISGHGWFLLFKRRLNMHHTKRERVLHNVCAREGSLLVSSGNVTDQKRGGSWVKSGS